ncbi:MAG: hypothetical protein Q9181_005483 [Wetmoreana brouardii]
MLSILRKARLKDKEMRILMLGLDNAGKTTVVKKLMNEDVNTVSPTLGFIIRTIDYEGLAVYIVDMRFCKGDVGGQKTLRTYWRNYFEKTDALIWVVDSADRLRIADCKRELAGLLLEERLMGASLLVLANKTDIEGSMSIDEIRKRDSVKGGKKCRWNMQVRVRTCALPKYDDRGPADSRLVKITMAADDGSEDINDFLVRIRELGNQRDREDEERTRKLEEEILQGRKERQARRAERARSISPTKEPASTIGTPSSTRSTADSASHERITKSPITFEPPNSSLEDALSTTPKSFNDEPFSTTRSSAPRDLYQPPSKTATLSNPSPSTNMTPSRAGTLSWQQRPGSRGSTGPRARPLSQVAAENSASRSPRASVEPSGTSEREMSRDQIAESLGSKDPAWFRQTHERGMGSAAYRRNQDESMSDTMSMTGSMRLPGMPRESTMEPERQGSPASESIRSTTPSRSDSMKGGSIRQFKQSNPASLASSNGIRPPLPIMNSQIIEPPVSDTSSTQDKDSFAGKAAPMSPAQGRISPERLERPASPTKGLGGFVQSAMLKRSDSVNKRWSAQPGAGLSRGNSIASNRSGHEGPRYPMSSLNAPRNPIPPTLSREASPVANSRSAPSQSTAALPQPKLENERPVFSAPTEVVRDTPASEAQLAKAALPREDSTQELPSEDKDLADDGLRPMSPLSSPSKRWSPAKSSWLENAINKPDSPKHKMPPPSQPSWMTNLNQARRERGSADLGKAGTFKEVSTGGFLRSPPMGAASKPTTMRGLPISFSDGEIKGQNLDSSTDVSNLGVNLTKQPSKEVQKSLTPELKPETPPVKESTGPPPAGTASMNSTPSKPAKKSPIAEVNETKAESPLTTKSKPETPLKKDFRSNLKPRQVSADKKPTEDPEFKNVFGKLKRTQTQNYVAPNELKENILRGKAGLAVTGGPKKTERRDEFKESLLKQKEAMKAAPPVAGRKPSAGDGTKTQTPTPSANLASREVSLEPKSSPSSNDINVAPEKQQPEALAQFSRLKQKAQHMSLEAHSTAPVKTQNVSPGNDRLGHDFNSSLAGMLSRGPSPLASGPSLGPKAMFKGKQAATDPSATDASQSTAEGPQLTHMTKSRARGPKRRLPTTSDTKETPYSQKPPDSAKDSLNAQSPNARSTPTPVIETVRTVEGSQQASPLASISNNHRKPSQPQPQPPRKPSVTLNKTAVSNVSPFATQTAELKPTSPQPRSPPSTKPKPSAPSVERLRKPSASAPSLPNTPPTLPSERCEVNSLANPAMSQSIQAHSTPPVENTFRSVKGAAATWTQGESHGESSRLRARSPVKLPTRQDKEAAMQDAGLVQKAKTINGLGISNVMEEPGTVAPPNHGLPTPPLSSPKSPPLPGKKPASIANRVVSNTATGEPVLKANGSPIPQTSEATRLFAELFDESPNTDVNVDIDAPAVLSSRAPTSETDKIRTLRKQTWEVTAGGTLIPVPPDQGHILFEESMYICHHVFGSLAGTRTTEVYLWCGDGVATSAVEDAQIFARKEAKDHGGKLIVLPQGKETTRFFQALGGIVITRHGQSDRASSRYMLCGRRHVGQIAFDEVEFSPRSLCKGFPYIISSGSSKLQLWKGSGSGVDELGCARLIGMDLGLGGEIEEVEDGREPDNFWRLFSTGQQQSPITDGSSSSKHWKLKPSAEKYATRLYQVDIEAPRPKSSSGFKWGRRGSAPASEETGAFTAQIREIVPFAQTDVFHDGVFMLDVFFEIFIILPSFPSTSTLLPTFRTTLLFAQEYAILAASAHDEDRPFVPAVYVVLLGVGRDVVPEGLRMAFRKWDEGKVRGCKVLGLAACIEATRGG